MYIYIYVYIYIVGLIYMSRSLYRTLIELIRGFRLDLAGFEPTS